MEKETTELALIFLGCLVFVALGAGMFLLARWSRKKNAELKAKGDASQVNALKGLIKQGKRGGAFKAYVAGTLSESEASVGKILAVIAIAICVVFLAVACPALIKAI